MIALAMMLFVMFCFAVAFFVIAYLCECLVDFQKYRDRKRRERYARS